MIVQVSAEKQDYDIKKSEEREHDFVATKLSKLTVSIKQGKLSRKVFVGKCRNFLLFLRVFFQIYWAILDSHCIG